MLPFLYISLNGHIFKIFWANNQVIHYLWETWIQNFQFIINGASRSFRRLSQIYKYIRCAGRLLPRTRSASEVKWSRLVSKYVFICLWTKKKFESYFSDWLTFSNLRSRTSRRIYRLALLLLTPEKLSSLSKSRIFIFNVHLTLFDRSMMSHNSIGKYRHLVNWLGTCGPVSIVSNQSLTLSFVVWLSQYRLTLSTVAMSKNKS